MKLSLEKKNAGLF